MATCTGFCYEYDNQLWIITNAHNVTRINHETGKRITSSAAFPVLIITEAIIFKEGDNTQFTSCPVTIMLYRDEDCKFPNWCMHPKYGYGVDVIAIPVEPLAAPFKTYPINKFEFDDKILNYIEPSDDVFILGYPLNITGSFGMPIWKRGSVASEPGLPVGGLPKFLVDTATRKGMSGSPVIMQRSGVHGPRSSCVNQLDMVTIGTLRSFVGVYSGRIGEDEFQAQLRVVWRKTVIEEIVSAKIQGDISFQNR